MQIIDKIKKILKIKQKCNHKSSKWMYTNGIDFYDKQKYYDDYLCLKCDDCGYIIQESDL